VTMVRARRYDPSATAGICVVCRVRLDHAMYPYCDIHLPLEHPARRPAPPPGGMFTLEDVTGDLDDIEELARAAARDLGHRPRSSIIFTDALDEYERLVGEPALRLAGERRGLCGPGPAGARVIWVAPAPRWDLFETITHEVAHAVLPLRTDHNADWLHIHVATLARITSPQHAALVRRQCEHLYAL